MEKTFLKSWRRVNSAFVRLGRWLKKEFKFLLTFFEIETPKLRFLLNRQLVLFFKSAEEHFSRLTFSSCLALRK